jgi:DNA-binding MarR family transcriptional regulator
MGVVFGNGTTKRRMDMDTEESDGQDARDGAIESRAPQSEARDVDWKIVEHVNGLALLGARRIIATRGALKGAQKVRLLPFVAGSLAKEGRPGFLLIFDVTRTLALEGEMTISEIAAATGRPLSTASRLVDGLEGAGLVRRTGNPADGRSMLVGLTDNGRKLVSEVKEQAAGPLLKRLERLSARERRTLERLLGKLAATEDQEGEL